MNTTCETCLGSGRIATGPWGARPAKTTCPACSGSGQARTTKRLRRYPWDASDVVTVDLQPVRSPLAGGRAFDVYLDGAKLGQIYEHEGQRERPTHKGSRIVNRGKPRMFWFVGVGYGRRMRDSQAAAIRELLRDAERSNA